MRAAIHQPNFLPRLWVLQKLASADCWVVLDCVQFAQREWQNRTRILPVNANQIEFWMSLPVSLPQGQRTLINDVKVSDLSRTLDKCRQSIWHAFRSAQHWDEVVDYWDEVEKSIRSDGLTDVVLPTITVALQKFASLPNIKCASEIKATGQKSTLMANICEALNATEYLADSGARAYLKPGDFANTKVAWQQWQEPLPQPDCQIKWKDLSFLNFLARNGPMALREHLLSGIFRHAPSFQTI